MAFDDMIVNLSEETIINFKNRRKFLKGNNLFCLMKIVFNESTRNIRATKKKSLSKRLDIMEK
jgi:hypothetical protein